MTHPSASPHRILVSVFALLGAIGCKQEEPNIAAKDYPSRMAFGYCEAVYNCPCETYPYSNFNACYGALTGAYDEVNDEAYLAGLAYDGSCPAKELEQIEQLACKNWLPELPAGVCVRPCNAWYGPAGPGQVCTVVASAPEIGVAFSTCAQGLTCFSGVCVDPCQISALPKIGEPCPDLVCEAGAMCDADQICVAMPDLPGPAEACLNGQCDPDRAVCVADANICAALPTVGQDCVQSQCDRSAYCGPDDICLARPPLACGLVAPDSSGDGDGDPTGDGDGDPTTGDGDGDPTTGDGDGDNTCGSMALANSLPAFASGTTSTATDSHSGSCGGAGPDVSYTFVAPVSGYYWMTLAGSSYDTVLYVRDGDCNGVELACNDDYDDSTSAVEVYLETDQLVTIIVDGYDGSGSYQLSVDMF
ncbi:MAG: PPC domain-containing protein [Enhygromyxa sp.]